MDEFKNISLRAVEQDDMNAVIELLQSISDFKPPKSEFLRIWFDFCAQPNHFSIVAVIDNQIVGYGSITIETKIRGGKVGHVEDIVSHSEFQNRGIGTAILAALYERAKAQNCFKVVLQCKEFNADFYKKCGYGTSGVAMQMFVK